MSKSNRGCCVEFEMSCSLSEHCTPSTTSNLNLSGVKNKQTPADLVLVLTVLAATTALMIEDFLGAFPLTKHQVISPLHQSYVSQCCFVFYVVVLEMPKFSGNHGRAKLNVAELCWQIHGSYHSLCSQQQPAAWSTHTLISPLPSHKTKWHFKMNDI